METIVHLGCSFTLVKSSGSICLILVTHATCKNLSPIKNSTCTFCNRSFDAISLSTIAPWLYPEKPVANKTFFVELFTFILGSICQDCPLYFHIISNFFKIKNNTNYQDDYSSQHTK